MSETRTKAGIKGSFLLDEEDAWVTPKPIEQKKKPKKKEDEKKASIAVPIKETSIEGEIMIVDIERIRKLPITTGNNQHRVVISESIFQVFESYCFDKKDKYSGTFINKLLYEIAKTPHFDKFNKHLDE